LSERTDITISRKNLEVSRLGLEVTRQALMPSLGLSAGYSLSGQGGTQRLGNTIIPGGYVDALRAIGGFDSPRWNVGLNLNYPLGKTQERANVARAEISLEQNETQLKVQELTISTQVINAGLAVENSYKQYQAAVKNREAQERSAEGARVRYENGLVTNFDVVNAETSVFSSRLQELNRLIAYMNALAEFDRVQRIN
jgi:outer membrane protein TolC